jgi:hypothetical protein
MSDELADMLDQLEWPVSNARIIVRRDQFHCYAYYNGKYYHDKTDGPDKLSECLKSACRAALGIEDEGVKS